MEEWRTKRRILEAARTLFEERGFDRTTVREVAAKAGANAALIHYHYGSKENLLAALVEQMSEQIRMRVTDINESKAVPMEKVDQVVDFYVDRLDTNRNYYQMMHQEMSTRLRPELHRKIMDILKRNRSGLRQVFEEGQRKKAFRKDIDIDLVMSTIFGLMYQTTHGEFSKKIFGTSAGSAKKRERIKQYLKDLLRRYLEN